jgi:hypothetical protein
MEIEKQFSFDDKGLSSANNTTRSLDLVLVGEESPPEDRDGVTDHSLLDFRCEYEDYEKISQTLLTPVAVFVRELFAEYLKFLKDGVRKLNKDPEFLITPAPMEFQFLFLGLKDMTTFKDLLETLEISFSLS